MIKRLNPIIRGWAAYYRTQVSSDTFGELDHYLWRLTYKWARFSHANKPTHLGVRPVLRQVQQGPARPVGVRRPPQRRLPAPLRLDQHRPTPDRQHRASPDDPALTEYWAWRRRKAPLPINNTSLLAPPEPRTDAVRSATARSSPSSTSHKPRANGSTGWRATRKTITIV